MCLFSYVSSFTMGETSKSSYHRERAVWVSQIVECPVIQPIWLILRRLLIPVLPICKNTVPVSEIVFNLDEALNISYWYLQTPALLILQFPNKFNHKSFFIDVCLTEYLLIAWGTYS